MAEYDVEITATVRKTIRVAECDSEQEAIETAHQLFSVQADDVPEKYDEQCTSVKLVEN
jgi:hypothetical protein